MDDVLTIGVISWKLIIILMGVMTLVVLLAVAALVYHLRKYAPLSKKARQFEIFLLVAIGLLLGMMYSLGFGLISLLE